MKNEDEKNEVFFFWLKIFQLYFSETLNLTDLKYVFQIFHILLRSKVTALQSIG